MEKRSIFSIFFLLIISATAFSDTSTDPYIFITSDTAKLANVQQICTSHGHTSLKEIGDIGWFTFDQTIQLIRPHHSQRKKLLSQLYLFILNNLTL